MPPLRPLSEHGNRPVIDERAGHDGKLDEFFSLELNPKTPSSEVLSDDSASKNPAVQSASSPAPEVMSQAEFEKALQTAKDLLRKIEKDDNKQDEIDDSSVQELLKREISERSRNAKCSELLIATKIKDLLATRLQQRRATGKTLHVQQDILEYIKETTRLQKYLKNAGEVALHFGETA